MRLYFSSSISSSVILPSLSTHMLGHIEYRPEVVPAGQHTLRTTGCLQATYCSVTVQVHPVAAWQPQGKPI